MNYVHVIVLTNQNFASFVFRSLAFHLHIVYDNLLLTRYCPEIKDGLGQIKNAQ